MIKDEHIKDFESRLMHQEKLVQELNTIVFRQQNEIDRLTAACSEMTRNMKALRDSSGAGDIIDTPPPHY